MRSVKMNTKELLEIVRANKTKHEADFKEAVTDYLTVVRKVTKENAKIARGNAAKAEAAARNPGANTRWRCS